MGYNGDLVSNLGVKKYLEGYEANKFSNINILQTRQELRRRWDDCDFGCHGPAYRVSRRDARYSETLNAIANEMPIAAGLIDGVAAKTVFSAEKMAKGVQRTGEGLGLAGREMQYQVGAENHALYSAVKVNVEQLLTLDLDEFMNPFCQMAFSVIREYIDLMPEQMLIEMIIAGAIVLEPSEDLDYYYAAVESGMLEGYSEHHVNESLGFLRSHGLRIISKQIGKQIPRIIAGFIASRITRGIMLNAKTDFAFKRKLVRLRSTYRVLRGGPAGALVFLLKANGWLGVAAAESRDLNNRCPRLWSYLRLELNGADMLYFLVKDFLREYVDRIAIIETDPAKFVSLMAALTKSGRTQEIFFPR